MNDSRPIPPPRATEDARPGVSSGPSNRPRPGRWHDLARWFLGHSKLVTTLAVLGFVAFCGWKAWAAFQPNCGWAEGDADRFVIEDRMDRTSLMLAGMVAWMFLASVVVRGKLDSMKWSGWDSLSFNARVRARVLRGVPIRGGVLLAYALFGLAGLAIGLALTGRALFLLPWLGSATANVPDQLFSAPVLAVFAIVSASRLLWDILIQAEWDYFVGDRRAQIAEEFLRGEEAGREEEWEEQRTSVGRWSWAVLSGGFVGGIFLSSRLPESEQGLCILSALAGLVAAGIAIYVARTKPRGGAGWLALVALLFAAALVYAWHAFDHPTTRALLLGVTGGVTVGGMFMVLYLRKIRRHSTPDMQKQKRSR